MYYVGDKVIHQQEGACLITGTMKMGHDKIKDNYFILEPIHDRKSKVYISAVKKSDRVRPAISQKQMKEFEEIAESHIPEWVEAPKDRVKAYSKTLRDFEFLEVLLLLKNLMVQNVKKKLSASDQHLLLSAEKLIYSEVSIVADKEYRVVAENVEKFLCAS